MIIKSLRIIRKLNTVNYSWMSEMETRAINDYLDSIEQRYKEVIEKLNILQSNAAILNEIKPCKKSQEPNIALTSKYLNRCGINLDLLEGKVIHVSGTKGKGSTCALIESILRSHNFTTGFYSSPHLFSVTERIRINGKPISQNLFTDYFWHVYNILDNNKDDDRDMPTYFKFLTLLAFKVFICEKVDVAIVEVGIGGEYDCTNILRHTSVVGVTSLGYDHLSTLGNTIEEIAWNKAGIMKEGCLAFTCSDQPPSALQVLKNRAKEKNCELLVIERDARWKCLEKGNKLLELNSSLAVHMALAWIAIRTGDTSLFPSNHSRLLENGIDLDDKSLKGLMSCVWPGRFEVLIRDNITYYLDGAHTEESILICCKWFLSSVPDRGKKVLVFNLTGTRKPNFFLEQLVDCGFEFACFCPNILDSSPPIDNFSKKEANLGLERCKIHADLWKNITLGDGKVFSSISETFQYLHSLDQGHLHVLVTGSLHLVGNVTCYLQPYVWQS